MGVLSFYECTRRQPKIKRSVVDIFDAQFLTRFLFILLWVRIARNIFCVKMVNVLTKLFLETGPRFVVVSVVDNGMESTGVQCGRKRCIFC